MISQIQDSCHAPEDEPQTYEQQEIERLSCTRSEIDRSNSADKWMDTSETHRSTSTDDGWSSISTGWNGDVAFSSKFECHISLDVSQTDLGQHLNDEIGVNFERILDKFLADVPQDVDMQSFSDEMMIGIIFFFNVYIDLHAAFAEAVVMRDSFADLFSGTHTEKVDGEWVVAAEAPNY